MERKRIKKYSVRTSFTGVSQEEVLAHQKIKEHKKSKVAVFKNQDDTSWGGVGDWYDKHLQSGTTNHDTVVYPRLTRLLGDVRGKKILDLACGQGIFSYRLANDGALVTGVDLGRELIDIAKKESEGRKKVPDFFVSPSHDLYMIKDGEIDIVIVSLAIQNIEDVKGTFTECERILKNGGRLFLVMNHPAFRIPKESSWGFDEKKDLQYRRLDSYLSEQKVKIDMTPGSEKDKKYTYSFHRPLQYYSKLLEKSNFLIKRIEEWESIKASEPGTRQKAENKARKEFPLFLCLEAVQLKNDKIR